MKYVILITLLISQVSFAVTMKPAPKTAPTKNRMTANTDYSAEIKVLSSLIGCVKTGTSPDGIRACSKDLLSESLKQKHRDLVLTWFEQQVEISYPAACPASDLEFIDKAVLAKSKTTLCSNFSRGDQTRQVMFFMSEEKGQPRLLNLKER
jgi:hypothetical protein